MNRSIVFALSLCCGCSLVRGPSTQAHDTAVMEAYELVLADELDRRTQAEFGACMQAMFGREAAGDADNVHSKGWDDGRR